MAWVAVAAVGVGTVQNRKSRKAGDKAAANAGANTGRATDAMEKGISYLDAMQPAIDNFAKMGQDQFSKYQRLMGPLEETVSDYYQNLNPDELAAQGNQTAQQQFQGANKQMEDQLIAQGIDPKMGIGTQLGMDQANQMAQTKAQNIMSAPGQVAQQQQGYLGQMQNQSNNAFNQMTQGVNMQNNQANQYNQAYNNMANMYGGAAQNSNQAAQGNYAQGNQALQNGMMMGGYMYNRNHAPKR